MIILSIITMMMRMSVIVVTIVMEGMVATVVTMDAR